MPSRITKLQRWFDLIALLVGRQPPVEVDEIMERVPVDAENWKVSSDTDRLFGRRTFQRDKDELGDFGIPLETAPSRWTAGMEKAESKRLRCEDFQLPYLKLVSELARE